MSETAINPTRNSLSYWNKKIPIIDDEHMDSSLGPVKIGAHNYYGKKITKLNKFEIVIKRIIPIFFISIVAAPFSIPLFTYMRTYRHLGRWIREVHYGRKLKCINNIAGKNIKKNSSISEEIVETVHFPQEIINLFLKNSKYSKDEFIKYSLVNKSWHDSVHQARLQLINNQKIKFCDIPGIQSVNDQINFMRINQNKIHTLKYTNEFTKENFPEIIDFLANLININVQGRYWFEDEDIQKLNKYQNLNILNLSMCENITDKGMAHLAKIPSLSVLDLSWSNITDQGLACLARLPNLRALNLTGCIHITDKGIESLNHFPQLIWLNTPKDYSYLGNTFPNSIGCSNRKPLFLRCCDGKTKSIKIDFSMTTEKNLLAIAQKIDGMERIIYGGREILDLDIPLDQSTSKIQKYCTINLVARLRGD